jgi:hypothetical protein
MHQASSALNRQADNKTASATCCKIHGEPLKLHCTTCNKTICMECGVFDHSTHTMVKIADLTAESREAILHQVECTSIATTQLGEARAELQACCGQVEVSADASKQYVDAFAKQVRQALSASVDAVNVKVDGSTSRKLGASDRFLALLIDGRGGPTKPPPPGLPSPHPSCPRSS